MIIRVPESAGYELEIKARGDVMKPIPQEKCIIIKTSGSLIRSSHLFPITRAAVEIVAK
jgi:hypothetical protein